MRPDPLVEFDWATVERNLDGPSLDFTDPSLAFAVGRILRWQVTINYQKTRLRQRGLSVGLRTLVLAQRVIPEALNNPSLRQLAAALGVNPDRLAIIAGRIPQELGFQGISQRRIIRSFDHNDPALV